MHDSLNPAQLAAATHVNGPLLILAGPGSGKTRVVTHRIAFLLEQGIDDRSILALTFTNKAADEMRTRVARLVPGAEVRAGTFHSFCAYLLRRYARHVGLEENYSIYDADDSRQALAQSIAVAGLALERYSVQQIARAISSAKNQLVTAENYTPATGNPVGSLVAQVYPIYQQRLLECCAVDFDDLLLHVVMLLRESEELRAGLDERYRYIMVDEYQDTNLAQYAIVRALSRDHPNLAVTGDPDQSIYGWRGANLNNILNFEHDYPDVKVVRLEQNYRSTRRILRVADALIANNQRRKLKSLFTQNDEGARVRLIEYPDHFAEADHISARIARDVSQGARPADFAVFYRTNALSRVFEQSLRRHGVPYQVVNSQEFYGRREVKDVLAYLHLINNPRHDVALLRIINTPTRGIGKRTIERLVEDARRRQVPFLDAARRSGLNESLSKRAAVQVARFVSLVDRLGEFSHAAVVELVRAVLRETGYEEQLKSSQTEEDQQRLENLYELVSAAQEFDERHGEPGGLERFLEETSLISDADSLDDAGGTVKLMTLHSAKGLEFPVVFVTAIEQGILPHQRSRDSAAMIEEERRLLFVGITRAKSELQISHAGYRTTQGIKRPAVPSTFLMELPRREMEVIAPPRRSLPRDDEEYSQLGPPEEEANDGFAALPPASPAPAKLPPLKTAAELLAETGGDVAVAGAEPPRADPAFFRGGMRVRHPQYGEGIIVRLSGSGVKRAATVRFIGSGDERRFRLAFSPLEAAGQ